MIERRATLLLLMSFAAGCVGGGANAPAAHGGAGGANDTGSGTGSASTPRPDAAHPVMADAGGSQVSTGAAAAAGAGAMPMGVLAAGAKDSHYPLADRATWVYHHTKPTKADWDENDSMRATSYMGKSAFIFEDQEDAQGVQTHSTLRVDGSGVYRVYQEESVAGQTALTVAYDPAFLRFDEAWTKTGQTITLTDNWVQTCIVGGTAASKCAAGAVMSGMTTHEYTVVDAAAKVTVPAGSFDTVEIRRVDPATGETKLYWFASGVGKVRDETPASMAVTVLTAYEIP